MCKDKYLFYINSTDKNERYQNELEELEEIIFILF